MAAYDFDSDLKRWTKTCCVCDTTIVGTEDEDSSAEIFAKEFNPASPGARRQSPYGDGLMHRCRKCDSLKLHLDRGINRVVAERMLIAQNGKCAICSVEISLEVGGDRRFKANVDHCHATDTTRGLLCGNCNKALGLFDDNIDVMYKALGYLIKYRNRSGG